MDASVPIFKQTLGPLGLDVPPMGETGFEALTAEYRARIQPGRGAVHISGMTTMAECRAALTAVREAGGSPAWVSWICDGDGESPTRVHMLAALFVAEGMGAAAFGLDCPENAAAQHMAELAQYAHIPLFQVREGVLLPYPYTPTRRDPDVIPCATGAAPCFVTRTVDVGEEIECGPDLLEDISRIPGDYWIRFMSSHPKDATPRLFDVMAASRHVARQLHLPFQSGNNRVLQAMNRRYTREKYLDLIRCAREAMPGLVLTSDVIIGFPGETRAEAMDTVSLVEEVGFDALFTFLYSPRPGTRAAELPDPASREDKQRWFDRLLEVQNGHSARIHAGYVGKTVRVLADGESGDEAFPLSSRTEGNRLVRLKGDKELIGRFLDVRITGSNTWALYGEL